MFVEVGFQPQQSFMFCPLSKYTFVCKHDPQDHKVLCNCSMFCCTLLCVRSSIAMILMGKRELVSLLNLSSWCLVMVERLFLAVPQGCLRFVIVIFPDHTHLLFSMVIYEGLPAILNSC